MNGNNPYAGAPGVTNAGEPAAVDLSGSRTTPPARGRRNRLANRTESYLPNSYAVGSELSVGTNGPQATVAVNPPAGHPVSAGFTPDPDELEAGIADADTDEVARGPLAASAAMQVMDAVGDVTPTAK